MSPAVGLRLTVRSIAPSARSRSKAIMASYIPWMISSTKVSSSFTAALQRRNSMSPCEYGIFVGRIAHVHEVHGQLHSRRVRRYPKI